jgi:hypothetical protein
MARACKSLPFDELPVRQFDQEPLKKEIHERKKPNNEVIAIDASIKFNNRKIEDMYAPPPPLHPPPPLKNSEIDICMWKVKRYQFLNCDINKFGLVQVEELLKEVWCKYVRYICSNIH